MPSQSESSYSTFIWRPIWVSWSCTLLECMKLTSTVGSNLAFHSDPTLVSSGPVPKALQMYFWSTTGVFEMLVLNFRNWTFCASFFYASCGNTDCVSLVFCIHSTVTRPHLWVTTTTIAYIFTRMVMRFALGLVACSVFSSSRPPCDNFVFCLSVVDALSIATGAECSGAILRFMRYSSNVAVNIRRSEWGIDCQYLGDSEPNSDMHFSHL